MKDRSPVFRSYSDLFDFNKFDDKSAQAWCNKGHDLKNMKRYEEAIAAYDRVIQLDPKAAHAWCFKGDVLANLKRYEEAIASYDHGIQLDPENKYLWLGKGKTFVNLNRYEEVIAAFDRAIQLDPQNPFIWTNKGEALANLKHYDEAIIAYDCSIRLYPQLYDSASSHAWVKKGESLANLKRYEEAIAACDRATQLAPKSPFIWEDKGDVLTDLKHYDEAIAAYNRAIQLNPDNTIAWLKKGIVLVLIHKYEEAIDCYDRALKIDTVDIDPNDIDANDILYKKLMDAILNNIPKPQLSIKFDLPQLWFGESVKATILIENCGNGKANDIKISFSDDFQIRGIKPLNLDAGAITTLDFGISPLSKGKLPFETIVICRNEYGVEYKQTNEFWIDVIERMNHEKPIQTEIHISGENVHVGDSNQTNITDSVLVRSQIETANSKEKPVCTDCGEEISSNSKWCSNCGNQLK